METLQIEITGQGFKPDNVILQPHNMVKWLNNDNKPHSVKAEDGHSFNSSALQPGEVFEYHFHEKGIYGYYDELNPRLRAEISISNIPSAE